MKMKFSLKALLQKSSVKNGVWMYLLQAFNTVIPLFTLPYITRILGEDRFGVFSIALNLISYLQVAVEYGFGMSATRKVALCGYDVEKLSKLHSSVLYARIALFGCSALVIGGYTLFHLDDLVQLLCLLWLSVSLIGYVLQQDWIFQGLQDMKYISLISIIGRIVSVVLIFIFVKDRDDVALYSLLYAVSPFLSGVVGFVLVKVKYKLRLCRIPVNELLEELKSGWYVFTTSLSSKVFGAIGVTFLGVFAAESVVGVYSAIQKIPQMMLLAWTPISQVLYPITSKRMNEGSFAEGKAFVSKMRAIFLLPFICLAALIALFGYFIVNLAFGSEYSEFYYWIYPLLVWMILAINNNFLGIQTLLGSGHDAEYSKCFQVGVICTVILNLVLIYFFGGFGAAIAPALSEFVLGILLVFRIKTCEKAALTRTNS